VMSMSLGRWFCLSVREHISETTLSNFTNFCVRMVVSRSFSGSVAIRYLLEVLWMTSRLPTSGGMLIPLQRRNIVAATSCAG